MMMNDDAHSILSFNQYVVKMCKSEFHIFLGIKEEKKRNGLSLLLNYLDSLVIALLMLQFIVICSKQAAPSFGNICLLVSLVFIGNILFVIVIISNQQLCLVLGSLSTKNQSLMI